MYNGIELRDELRPLVTVSETTNIDYRAHFALALLRAYAVDLRAFTVQLTRNLRDDTYSVTLTGDGQANLTGDRLRDGGRLYHYSQINVNNKYGGHNAQPDGAYARGVTADFIHHSVLASVPFTDSSLISFDWLVDNTPTSPLRFLTHLINLTLTLTHPDVPTTLNLQGNEVGLIRTLKELRLSFNPSALPAAESSYTVLPPTLTPFHIETFYNYLVVVPAPLSQTRQTRDVAELYVFNDNGQTTTNDYQAGKVTYHSSSGTSALEAAVEHGLVTSFRAPLHKIAGGTALHTLDYVGTIRVIEMTSFDYARQVVVRGLTNKAASGDLVPFNFKGDFVQQIDFAPNAPFAKMKLRINHPLIRPQLDPFSGRVQLVVTEVVVDFEPRRRLSLASIKRVRAQFELKTPLDLVALQRLSD